MLSSSKASRGFSLVELLVVLAIIAVLARLSFQSLSSINSSKLTTAAIELRNAAEQARQTAAAYGYPVELRLYEPTGSTGYYSAFQIVEINGPAPQTLHLMRLPDGIVITNAANASSILTAAPTTNAAPAGFIAANTSCIRFVPLGSIQGLSSTSPQTLSLVSVHAPVVSNGLPNDYATISFDPVLGSTALYRP